VQIELPEYASYPKGENPVAVKDAKEHTALWILLAWFIASPTGKVSELNETIPLLSFAAAACWSDVRVETISGPGAGH
jgi:hypothetical protein